MCKLSTKRTHGFTLLEMLIATALGLIILAAAVQVYVQGVSGTWTVTQRAELQQDFRAASNMLTKDLSLAGAGLNPGTAIALPSGSTPQYGCDQSTACYLGASNSTAGTYPIQSGTPYLYGLIPGYDLGPTLAPGATDVVTVVYTDSSFYLNCYIPSLTTAKQVTFSEPSGGWANTGCLPNGVSTPQAVNDAAVGLIAGDLVMMKLGSTNLVVEVSGTSSPLITTGTDASGHTTYTVPFANGDPLKMNQTATGYLLNSINTTVTGSNSAAPCGGTGPCRLLVVTYYIDNTTTPARLMRQISGHSPMPVVEGLANLKFSYDLYNSATSTAAVGCTNPGASTDGCGVSGASTGLLPNQITKINIASMAVNSTMWSAVGNGYQGLALQTSVSARNLTYTNNYPN